MICEMANGMVNARKVIPYDTFESKSAMSFYDDELYFGRISILKCLLSLLYPSRERFIGLGRKRMNIL